MNGPTGKIRRPRGLSSGRNRREQNAPEEKKGGELLRDESAGLPETAPVFPHREKAEGKREGADEKRTGGGGIRRELRRAAALSDLETEEMRKRRLHGQSGRKIVPLYGRGFMSPEEDAEKGASLSLRSERNRQFLEGEARMRQLASARKRLKEAEKPEESRSDAALQKAVEELLSRRKKEREPSLSMAGEEAEGKTIGSEEAAEEERKAIDPGAKEGAFPEERERIARGRSRRRRTEEPTEAAPLEKAERASRWRLPVLLRFSPAGELSPREKEERRKQGIRIRRMEILLLILGILLVLVTARFQSIEITGNRRYSEEEIRAMLFPGSWDTDSFYQFLKEHTREHAEYPFIESYELHWKGPLKLKVRVREKNVVAYVGFMSSRFYFDRDGMVVESTQEPLEGVPRIEGLDFGSISLHKRISVKNDRVFHDIMNLTNALSELQISCESIRYDDSLNATLNLGDIKVKLGADQDMEEKISCLREILPKLSGRRGELDLSTYLDRGGRDSFIFTESK